ncbi:alpha/beta-hydrolase family protein [Terrabacter sp. NPDC080008]|uniref:alpha/beta hydrolase n=1 Tax=Terrabacter sp. NPDC080008 TaxID=3155176 RepID=UPI0034501FFF
METVVQPEERDQSSESSAAPVTEQVGSGQAGSGEAPPRRWGRLREHVVLSLPGCWGALVLACLSFTPSLLPRGGFLQGLICGITAAIGYGAGVVAAWAWRAFADRQPRRPRAAAWRTLAIVGGVLLAVFFVLGQYWQARIRDLMGVTDYSLPLVIASPWVAVVVFGLLLWVGRGLRRLYRRTAGLLDRWVGHRAARAVGWVVVVAATWLLVSGVLLQGAATVANQAFSVRNTETEEGAHQPTSALRSGGPGSLVDWTTLGRQGRNFTGLGPTAVQIQKLTHAPAMEPVRAYAGLDSAPDAESRAALAVSDLQRAGGFARKNLLVVTTTGSGWVDPAMVDSFEYLTHGDSATVSMQYSYLPSWISYLVDQSKAREAGRSLFDAVYDKWSSLSPHVRPRLFVAGESLGSFGGETAFSGEYDLRNRTAGTLFVGPPNFNTLFREFSDHRASDSPEIQPVYKGGRTVRFSNDPAVPAPPTSRPWEGTRVLYLMHPSDPIVWWSPNLVFHEPDWIAEPAGSDVLDRMVWIPFVTFWQVTADLPFSTGVPGGHGHTYTSEYVDGWNAILRPAGVTSQQLADLRAVISTGQ